MIGREAMLRDVTGLLLMRGQRLGVFTRYVGELAIA